ncbi:efflux RND transporter periplasmic adaptor subunit [Geofilum sp. OHC36d9]|uniref:efflux RND transporter periplasmic adaptor subunit n=1 Tax=Geofilum sp. OHC36d9 TaxID=3458413 RepID=UPI004033B793
MKRYYLSLIIITIAAFTYSCSQKADEDKNNKKELLGEYRVQANQLQQKIAVLEKELANSSAQGAINVTLSPLKPETFEHFIEVMGLVHSDKNLLISPETTGNIVEILIKEGDKVKKGQVLARLNTDALDRSIQEMEVNLELVNTLYERQAKLWADNIGSEVQYLQAKSNKETLEKRLESLKAQKSLSVITSPINGVIDDLMQKQGEMASSVQPFARVVNLDQVYVTGEVAEVYLNKIKKGDQVQVQFPVLDLTRHERISRTASVLDPDSRTFSLRIDMNNNSHQILPNLMAVIKLRTFIKNEALVVPSILVKKDFDGEFLFVAETNNNEQMVARKRYIQTSVNDNNRTLIDSGLQAGDRIITEGFAQVSDGSLLKVQP